MATGAYDANGIWQYGESDNIAPFSTTLNKLASSASSAITADRARLATLEAGSLSGLIPVVPGTVTAVTGTAAVNSLGVVTFTGCSAVRINSVFTSQYRNYLIIFNYSGNQSPDVPMFRLRVGANDQTGADYYYAGLSQRPPDTTPGVWNGNGVTQLDLGRCNNTNSSTIMNVYNPQTSTRTTINWSSQQRDQSSMFSNFANCQHNSVVQCDGFSFYDTAVSGLLTGSLQVFGYND